jgi:hypothetical protein
MTAPVQALSRAGTIEVFLVAGEESGDRLGAALMRALRERTAGQVRFAGVGGREMTSAGLASLYSIDDLAIIGFSALPRRIPRVLPHPLDRADRGREPPGRARGHRQSRVHAADRTPGAGRGPLDPDRGIRVTVGLGVAAGAGAGAARLY